MTGRVAGKGVDTGCVIVTGFRTGVGMVVMADGAGVRVGVGAGVGAGGATGFGSSFGNVIAGF
jgi:hypothetical protein